MSALAKKPLFADALSLAVMQERGIVEAFAFDPHFRTAGLALLP